MPAKSATRLRLSRKPLGYRIGRKFREGFPDDPGLTQAQRRRIAAWAQALAPETLTAEQEELLATPAPSTSSARGRAEQLAGYDQSPFWRYLSPRERALVRDPSSHGRLRSASYPLSVGQLATLANASPDQIRYWNQVGLLPARRSKGRQRQFFPVAAVRAFFLKNLGQSGISLLRKVRKKEAGPLFVGIAAVLAEEAATTQSTDQALLQQTATHLEKISSLA